MTIEVPMPQMGESIAEGTLVKWHKKVGERVRRDEPLFEISTDKVDTEVPAPQDGFLVEVLVKEGETVPVHTTVCVLGDAVPSGGAATGTPPTAGRAPASDGKGAAEAARTARGGEEGAGRGSASHGALAPGKGPGGGTAEARLREKSSPLVRRLASEHGIDLSTLEGSGVSGRVTKEDIERTIASREAALPGPAGRAPAEDRVEPLSVMRQRIAEHMTASRRTSAHVSSIFEVDMTAVRKLKEALAPGYAQRHGVKLTYMPFILRAVARGLRLFPTLNASIEGKNVRYHADVNIGIAVAVEEGLIVPVIPKADGMDLLAITRAVNDLARRARSKQLRPEEVQGGTFTVTNPGVFGSLIGTPIIHQPQVGILCLGAVTKRPVVIEESDAIAVRSMAFLSLSFDHRLIDGSVADRFLAEVKSQLETGGGGD